MDQKTKLFNRHRPELMNIAYGMLGTLSDAQDIVQDAYLKWNDVSLEKVNNPESYLKTIVSRLCIDHYRSAKQQREEYIGPWLPQPIADSDSTLPDMNIELHDKLTMALLHILENLSADQRAIFLLHDVFGYTFSEIGDLLDKMPAACRKAAQRARAKIRENSYREPPSTKEAQQTINDFIKALRSRDINRLQAILTDDSVMYSDGGGQATATPKPIESAKRISKFLMSIADKNRDNVSVENTMVNNRPGFKVFIEDELHSIWSFSIRDGQIDTIFSVLNPSKLIPGK
jgi:RNA polymerase sigma-70 factor (ECF subfamily)